MPKIKKALIIISVIVLVIALAITAFLIADEKLSRADWDGYYIKFDGHVYQPVSPMEIAPYTETWNIISKTKDRNWIIYEIEQYPGHEYIVARISWEAEVMKLIN